MVEVRFDLGDRRFTMAVVEGAYLEVREIVRVYDGQPERTETTLRLLLERDMDGLKLRACVPGDHSPVSINLDKPFWGCSTEER